MKPLSLLGSASVVDFDVTYFIQLSLFLLLLLLLRILLFKPLMTLLEKRREETEGKEEAGKIKAASAEELSSQYRKEMADAAINAMTTRNALRDQGIKKESEMLAQARSQSAEWLDFELSKHKQSISTARNEAGPIIHGLAMDVVGMVTRTGLSTKK